MADPSSEQFPEPSVNRRLDDIEHQLKAHEESQRQLQEETLKSQMSTLAEVREMRSEMRDHMQIFAREMNRIYEAIVAQKANGEHDPTTNGEASS